MILNELIKPVLFLLQDRLKILPKVKAIAFIIMKRCTDHELFMSNCKLDSYY